MLSNSGDWFFFSITDDMVSKLLFFYFLFFEIILYLFHSCIFI